MSEHRVGLGILSKAYAARLELLNTSYTTPPTKHLPTQHLRTIYHDIPICVIDDLPVRPLTVPDMIALLQTMWNSLDLQWIFCRI